ncbi:MAG: galactose-1-phosphate uridylyltransferase [Firmicutes bacterium]|nr:galactose-1-phosphate uridylyltransferase [Bacillota bacterium]
MPEIRRDILTGQWIILADNRMGKPYDFEFMKPQKEIVKVCSFCPGNEHMTTETIYEEKDDSGWIIRVFANKYPAVEWEREEEYSFSEDDVNVFGKAAGRHEIIVDTPEHAGKIQDFSIERYDLLLKALRERYRDMSKEKIIKYIHIFKNCGAGAGASISHSHWQMIGIPFIPKENEEVMKASEKYFRENGKSIFESIIESEKKCGKRVVSENDRFIAFAPFASRFAFELTVMDKEGGQNFGQFSDEKIDALCGIFKDSVVRVSRVMRDVCFNISFNDAPLRQESSSYNHWCVRIIPRIGNLAGFELGTGGYINPVFPETAAEFYRSLKIEE